MTLGEEIEGETFLKMFGQDLASGGELPAVAGQKLSGFVTGIVKTGGVEDAMDCFPDLVLPFLGHPRQDISDTVDGTALPGNFRPDIFYRFQQPLVTIGDE